MYNVLIVDDHEFTLKLLGEQLKKYGDIFTPIYAKSGQEALDILKGQEISLLVTDLIMPGKYDGWALIDYIKDKKPDIPCIAITSCDDKDKIEHVRTKTRHILFKPIDIKKLVLLITEILNENLTRGSLQGFSVDSFLQILEMERKTCLLEISDSKGEAGLLYIKNGQIQDAAYKNMRGKEAACHLIAMENLRLKIKALPNRNIQKRVEGGMMNIILEASRIKDEAAQEKHHNQPMGAPFPYSVKKEDVIMTLETHLQKLRYIKGYKAAGIMNNTGEMLAVDSIGEDVDMENIGAIFHDVLRSSNEAAEKVGLQTCKELVMKTPDGLIVMVCSGIDAPVHFYLVFILHKDDSILHKDGNQALVKLQFDKMLSTIMDELG